MLNKGNNFTENFENMHLQEALDASWIPFVIPENLLPLDTTIHQKKSSQSTIKQPKKDPMPPFDVFTISR